MAMDFNTAGEQRENSLIPADTIATVHMTVRPGNAGEGGWLKRSNSGECMMLDCEFTVVDGQYAKRKFWGTMVTEGTTPGQQQAAEITGSRVRAILESARGIKPDDESETARNARKITSWGDLNGLRFTAKIGLETGKKKNPEDPSPNAERYKDKNVLDTVITPDRKGWMKVEQVARQTSMQTVGTAAGNVAAQANQNSSARPAWAS